MEGRKKLSESLLQKWEKHRWPVIIGGASFAIVLSFLATIPTGKQEISPRRNSSVSPTNPDTIPHAGDYNHPQGIYPPDYDPIIHDRDPDVE